MITNNYVTIFILCLNSQLPQFWSQKLRTKDRKKTQPPETLCLTSLHILLRQGRSMHNRCLLHKYYTTYTRNKSSRLTGTENCKINQFNNSLSPFREKNVQLIISWNKRNKSNYKNNVREITSYLSDIFSVQGLTS